METVILASEHKNKEIIHVIGMVLDMATGVVAQLKREKKATGDLANDITKKLFP